MNKPDTVNEMIYPFADYPFQQRKSARRDIIIARPFTIPLPSRPMTAELHILLYPDVRNGTEIMPLAPSTGFRVGRDDLRNVQRRKSKVRRAFDRYKKIPAPFFGLDIQLDFSEAITQELVPVQKYGEMTNMIFLGQDAEYMSRLRCALYTNGAYESQGLDLIEDKTKEGIARLEVNDGFSNLDFCHFYPLETGPLLANAAYNWIDKEETGTGYAHPLGFQYTPRYFEKLSQMGIILYQTDQKRVPF